MPPSAAPLTFATLQRRMLAHVRARLADGDLTERALARMAGISQPHMHNVLKGVRVLTSDIGDLLVGALGLSLLELAETDELGTVLEARRSADGEGRQIRIATGCLSAFERFPDVGAPGDWIRMPEWIAADVRRPILMAYSPDPEMLGVFRRTSHLLLEMDDAERLAVRPDCWYALRWGGAGFVRQLRRESGALAILGQRSWSGSSLPDRIPLGDLPALSVIRGRVAWYGQDPRAAVALDQSGVLLPIPAFS